MTLFLSLFTIACRAVPTSPCIEDADVDHNIDEEVESGVFQMPDELPNVDDIEDTAVEDTTPCNGYELYIVGLSQEAVDQGYEIGSHCFPTRPTLYLLDENVAYTVEEADSIGIGWTIAAASEGDIMVESVYGSIDFSDENGGGWSAGFDTIDELANRVFTYGYTTVRSNDTLWLGNNIPNYSSEGMDIAIGSYGDFSPITVPKGDAGEIWLSLFFLDLTIMPGDSINVEQFPVITWHADGVPTVMTKDMDYMPGDNSYMITFE